MSIPGGTVRRSGVRTSPKSRETTTPQYGVLVLSPAPGDPISITPEHLALLEAYPAKVEEPGGALVTGFALQPSTRARILRGTTIKDGPFAEAKEVVAGFFVLDAPDAATAVAMAQLNPAAVDGGAVEIRPLFVPPA